MLRTRWRRVGRHLHAQLCEHGDSGATGVVSRTPVPANTTFLSARRWRALGRMSSPLDRLAAAAARLGAAGVRSARWRTGRSSPTGTLQHRLGSRPRRSSGAAIHHDGDLGAGPLTVSGGRCSGPGGGGGHDHLHARLCEHGELGRDRSGPLGHGPRQYDVRVGDGRWRALGRSRHLVIGSLAAGGSGSVQLVVRVAQPAGERTVITTAPTASTRSRPRR